ncbi:MAG: ABC transporter permease [Spirochaetaceae bacterium]|nr:ABC transporter permease [Spirochaetaceae bacterium]
MALKANVKEAVVSLSAAKQRSLLALIGIVIGIGSVIAMLSVGTIAKQQALEQFRELGTDYLTIQVHGLGPGGASGTTLADAVGLPEGAPSVAGVAPWSQGLGVVVYAGKKVMDAPTLGVTGSFIEMNRLPLADGRAISDLDVRREYCVVGSRVASALRRAGAEPLVGEPIRLNDRIYTIVGVLRATPRWGMQPFDADRAIMIPFSSAERMFPQQGLNQVGARMTPDAHYTVATAEVREYFRRRAPRLSVIVQSAQRLIEQMQRQAQTFALLLAAIGSISLIVGGVGVMNVMLVSVTERRTEIGIRRALGARRFDIQSQFLTESIVLSLVGGVFGIVVGVGSTWIFCRFSGWEFMVDPTAATLGFVVACGVGVFFGLQPAHQAARLDPITALRSG